jgi:hypothetical protein
MKRNDLSEMEVCKMNGKLNRIFLKLISQITSCLIFLFLTSQITLGQVSTCVGWPGIPNEDKIVLEAVANRLGIELRYVDSFQDLGRLTRAQTSTLIMSEAFFSDIPIASRTALFERISRQGLHIMILLTRPLSKPLKTPFGELLSYTEGNTTGTLQFHEGHPDVLRELSALRIPAQRVTEGVYLRKESLGTLGLEALISFESANGTSNPLMVTKRMGRGGLIVSSRLSYHFTSVNETFVKLPPALPFMIFFKDAFGEFVWHMPIRQANFTIDDPWLIEPYGNLSYRGLLQEMERANFHTTIAFIPWNYDRSRGEVVRLFLENPNRYSIAFHGNNHDRQEFKDYNHTSFIEQEKDVKQALARMAVFRERTQIPVSQVMIFPHTIAPARTLGILKTHEFLASINSSIVPLNEKAEVDLEAALWPVVLRYYGLPIVQRYPASLKKSQIALLFFLEKPVLFYTHQDFFYANIAAFNSLAEYLNWFSRGKLQWMDLDELCRNMFMQRRREDGGYDLRLLTRRTSIKNSQNHDFIFRVQEVGTGINGIKRVVIGKEIYYTDFERHLRRQRVIRAGDTLEIEINYEGSGPIASAQIDKTEIKIYTIRLLSDFRDLVLSRNGMGRKFINIISKGPYGR